MAEQQIQFAKPPLPRLRQDLTLYAGPADKGGAPTWTLHDPARNLYFELDWVAFEIMSRLSLADADFICEQINAQTTLYVTIEDVEKTVDFLAKNELVYLQSAQALEHLKMKRAAQNKSWFDALLHGYLFFRIPIIHPDKLLSRALILLDFLFRKRFYQITMLAFAWGAWGVLNHWDTFKSTLVDTFSLEGVIQYAGAVMVVKLLHELGHALAAKKCGCRVPTMGLAFLVMWPVAYTDVTESWKLDSHKKRLMIASAGIVTEALIAAWSIFMWSVLPVGALKSLFFFLGTTSFAATIAINASPFMRFDGYFLLCDILGMPNLHGRSSAYTRWWLREKLFGLGDAEPEALDAEQRKFFLVFALITWMYRLVVFLGIAVLVYHYFFKALGIALFLVEIWFFVTMPIFQEMKFWHSRWEDIGMGFKQKPAYYLLVSLLLLLIVPFDFTVNAQGMFKSEQIQKVMAPQAAQIIKLPPQLASRVPAGAQLIGLDVPEIENRIKKAEARVETLMQQYGAAAFNAKLSGQQPIFKERLASAQKELDGLLAERQNLAQKALFAGTIVDVDPDLFLGEWVAKSSALVTLINDKDWVVDCYIEEDDLKRIDKGNWGRFVADAPGVGAVNLTVIDIDKDATRVMTEGALTSAAGGEVLVRPQQNKLIPERAVYRVRLKVDSQEKLSTGYIRGRVAIYGWPKSILGEFIRLGLATVWRETGF